MVRPVTVTDLEMLEFFKEFFSENDQLPPTQVTGKRFGVYPNAVSERMKRLRELGYLEKNAVGKYKRGPRWGLVEAQ